MIIVFEMQHNGFNVIKRLILHYLKCKIKNTEPGDKYM